MTTWTENDFDRLSWHDHCVHALALREGEDGTGALVLDLDFIVEWLKPNPTSPNPTRFRYLIAPATLTFRRVSDLKLSVDYASCGMGPFSIDGIERQASVYPSGHSTSLGAFRLTFRAVKSRSLLTVSCRCCGRSRAKGIA